jgi:eukaryotic-like serine/threonine-protein kinase
MPTNSNETLSITDFWARYDCQRTRPLDNFGQASVYPAVDTLDGQTVGIKIAEIHPAFDSDGQWGERYQRAMQQLHHPNLLQYQSLQRWELDNIIHYCLVMPVYSHGCLLHSVPYMDWSESQRHKVFAHVAESLDYLHSKGCVVQNLHASHVLMTNTDDGLDCALINYAQRERLPLAFISNYEYLAPEQFAADYKPTAQTDIWALGILGYWLWTGQLPFGKKSPQMSNRMIQQRILEDEVPSLLSRLPAPYSDLIARCLKKNPADRWASMSEILQRLPMPPPKDTKSTYIAPTATLDDDDDDDDTPRPLWQRKFLRRPSRPVNIFMVFILIALAILVGNLLNKLAN